MKILAVGMNYAQHNKELDCPFIKPKEPVLFMKADSALLKDGKPFFIPDFTNRCDYETELVIRICRLGKSISQRFAHRYYDAITVGVDFTARDVQERLRTEGLPWELCKSFDGSAAVGRFVSIEGRNIQEEHFHLEIDGKMVQEGCSRDMLYTVDEIIAYASRYFTLRQGDLLFTGTPVGVGPVQIGQHLEGYLGNDRLLDFNIR
ncbi:MAG: fumarylacetoacetate hydrolase family protein [Bacteroidaceae bacterium]